MSSLLATCYNLVEHVIEYMTAGPSLQLDSTQISQLHAAMVGAFNAVIHFLSRMADHPQCQVILANWQTITSYVISLHSFAIGNEKLVCYYTHNAFNTEDWSFSIKFMTHSFKKWPTQIWDVGSIGPFEKFLLLYPLLYTFKCQQVFKNLVWQCTSVAVG